MNVVVDTNVMVAGLLNPYGSCGSIIRMLLSGEVALCFDARILSEYEAVLKRPKFDFNNDNIDIFIDYLKRSGFYIAGNPLPISLPDSDDEAFLEVAIAAEVPCLITGNRKHFPEKRYQQVDILSPSEFLDLFKS